MSVQEVRITRPRGFPRTSEAAASAPVRVRCPAMTDDRSQEHGVNEDVRGTDRLTITEAATLLGVHPNTVRGRVKAGTYEAEKVLAENGFTWMIDRDSLVNLPLPKDSQDTPSQLVNPEGATPMEVVQDLLRPFVEDLGKVREELGAERVRREQAEGERDELRLQLEALTLPRDEPHGPETVSETTEGTETPPDRVQAETGTSSPTTPERRSSWLYRFFFGP